MSRDTLLVVLEEHDGPIIPFSLVVVLYIWYIYGGVVDSNLEFMAVCRPKRIVGYTYHVRLL